LEEAHRQLREQSIRDPLTGLFNRRYLEETLNRELARAKRHDLPLSLVMLDIDHFKTLNDTHGHLAGDEVLRGLASLIMESCRGDDLACRYGGEEFLLALPGMSLESAMQRAEQWRGLIEDTGFAWQDKILSITVSMGICAFPEQANDPAHLIANADQALYQAKEAGRNRVAAFH
jgi:diguanylate cyclase (GGDEF)-like protein